MMVLKRSVCAYIPLKSLGRTPLLRLYCVVLLLGVLLVLQGMRQEEDTLQAIDVKIHDREKSSEMGQKLNNAEVRLDLMGLKILLLHPCPGRQFEWMRMRIERMWSSWHLAAVGLLNSGQLQRRRQKKILLLIGTIAGGARLDEYAFKGGPLGELVQWADLVTSLYILGHDVIFVTEMNQLYRLLADERNDVDMDWRARRLPFDIVYTDINGLKLLKIRLNVDTVSGPNRCLFRILDSFGTEPAFNFGPYTRENKLDGYWNPYDLELQQHYTMFPHTADNSFMGFVIERPIVNSSTTPERRNVALVYAKLDSYFKGHKSYLDVVHEILEVHATATKLKGPDTSDVPDYAINHGLLHGPEYYHLLFTSKVFVGLGFPYEGPAPLEAIAAGCVFINPKFSPPHSRKNSAFYGSKPSFREITSQHPYSEDFIGEPFVYTIDIENTTVVRETLKKILNQKQIQPHMPFEFTEAGMLQRLNFYIEKQDFCTTPYESHIPDSDVIFTLSETDESCTHSCHKQGLLCEPSHFRRINAPTAIQQIFKLQCNKLTFGTDPSLPSVSIKKSEVTCNFQEERMLYSCAGSGGGHHRVCPCRTYRKGQWALCKGCI